MADMPGMEHGKHPPSVKAGAPGPGVVAPPFDLAALRGPGRVRLADYSGRPLVLTFWASWCIPCRDEAPVLQKTYERYRDQGLVVLGVDVNDFRQDARRFMKRYGLSYPVVYDGKGSTVGKWGVRGFPETFFVDRTGKLVGERIEGAVDIERNRDAFQRGVALALGNTP
jgi:cytochrome c biogenesis protein CcmG/thiol:disulfide interchange protein DsbE